MARWQMWLLFWAVHLATLTGEVLHRPGALYVSQGTVSLTSDSYRVLLHLQPYYYDQELNAMGEFVSNASSLLQIARQSVSSNSDVSTTVLNIMQTFEVQIQRANQTHSSLVAKSNILKELFPLSSSGGVSPVNSGRVMRQEAFVNLFGLASYGQMRELQDWAAATADTTADIVHAVEEQYTFINTTARKVNEHERRINDLTQFSVEYDERFGKLIEQSAAGNVTKGPKRCHVSLKGIAVTYRIHFRVGVVIGRRVGLGA